MKQLILGLPLTALLFFGFHGSAATTHYVDANGINPVSPYTNWMTAATNIQDAINHTAFGDLVLVTNGIYQYGGDSFNGSNRVDDINSVLIQSVNGPAVTIIKGYKAPGTTNGTGAVRCVYLREFGKLSGFTLTNGATPNFGNGGGVVFESSCIVSNCVITGNAADGSGGGAYSANNSLLVNCQITGNFALRSSAGTGGGAYGATLINCLLIGNKSGYRGGAAEAGTLINCTVAGNTGQPDSVDGCKLKNSIIYYNFPDNGDSSGDGNIFTNCCVTSLGS